MIRSYTDDQGYCQAVKDAGDAVAIGEFWTNGEQCGDAALMSTVWDFEEYYTDQFKAIQEGTSSPTRSSSSIRARRSGSRTGGRACPRTSSLRSRKRSRTSPPARRTRSSARSRTPRQGEGAAGQEAERRVPLRPLEVVRRRDRVRLDPIPAGSDTMTDGTPVVLRGITKRYGDLGPTTRSISTCAAARSTHCSARTGPGRRRS